MVSSGKFDQQNCLQIYLCDYNTHFYSLSVVNIYYWLLHIFRTRFAFKVITGKNFASEIFVNGYKNNFFPKNLTFKWSAGAKPDR